MLPLLSRKNDPKSPNPHAFPLFSMGSGRLGADLGGFGLIWGFGNDLGGFGGDLGMNLIKGKGLK